MLNFIAPILPVSPNSAVVRISELLGNFCTSLLSATAFLFFPSGLRSLPSWEAACHFHALTMPAWCCGDRSCIGAMKLIASNSLLDLLLPSLGSLLSWYSGFQAECSTSSYSGILRAQKSAQTYAGSFPGPFRYFVSKKKPAAIAIVFADPPC